MKITPVRYASGGGEIVKIEIVRHNLSFSLLHWEYPYITDSIEQLD